MERFVPVFRSFFCLFIVGVECSGLHRREWCMGMRLVQAWRVPLATSYAGVLTLRWWALCRTISTVSGKRQYGMAYREALKNVNDENIEALMRRGCMTAVVG